MTAGAPFDWMVRARLRPSPSGIWMSRNSKSGFVDWMADAAWVPLGALADQFDIRFLSEQRHHARPCDRLIVDNQRSDFGHAHAAPIVTGSVIPRATVIGSVTATRKPPSPFENTSE